MNKSNSFTPVAVLTEGVGRQDRAEDPRPSCDRCGDGRIAEFQSEKIRGTIQKLEVAQMKIARLEAQRRIPSQQQRVTVLCSEAAKGLRHDYPRIAEFSTSVHTATVRVELLAGIVLDGVRLMFGDAPSLVSLSEVVVRHRPTEEILWDPSLRRLRKAIRPIEGTRAIRRGVAYLSRAGAACLDLALPHTLARSEPLIVQMSFRFAELGDASQFVGDLLMS